MVPSDALPQSFLDELKDLELSYLTEEDPIRQSGFGGGPRRWREEREPILEAIETGGDLLDAGCANGYLLECLVAWGRERGLKITPHGLDQGTRLIELAKHRLPDFSANFHVGNAWDWRPPRQYRFVYTLHDCVPREYLPECIHRIMRRMVAPEGRLILGAYGSTSRAITPFDVAEFLRSIDLMVAGAAAGGHPAVASFAWVDNPS